MIKRQTCDVARNGAQGCGKTRTGLRLPPRKGIVLLAVIVFVALLLPVVSLVLTSINTESVSTAEAIKGAKADMASNKAIHDGISLVVQEKNFPAYWTSVEQPDEAITVIDHRTGFRRDEVADSGVPGSAGLDDILGTDDDYWLGPRLDGSYIGTIDTADSRKMYKKDFVFDSLYGPTYLGQAWSFSSGNYPYGNSLFAAGVPIPFFNQWGAVTTDDDGDGVNDGYDVDDPFQGTDEAFLFGPGYYVGADEPRNGATVVRQLDGANNIEQYMYNAKVNIYQSIFTDMDRGPIPTSLLKSYADVTDEAGRLNLNIFCKKVRVYMPESAETDYDFEGYGTDDFNYNKVRDEEGWKWMDNPLFPDRDSTLELNFNPTDGTFAVVDPIDFGSFNADDLFSSTLDGVSMPDLGETVQHYYEGDTDGDGIPQSVESMRNSIRMLESLPGIDPQLAVNILSYLNPSLDDLPAEYDPSGGGWPPIALGDVEITGVQRADAANMTPALSALEIQLGGGGTIDEFRWDFTRSDIDDLPLPSPRPLRTLDELRDVPGMTAQKYERLADAVTIFSYDVNVISSNIQDVSPDADLENPYVPGDPQYNGAIIRELPDELRDLDNVPDKRYDVSQSVFGFSLNDYQGSADRMYAYIREHLPKPLFDKITLPPVDRMGRADALDDMVPNTDPRYDLAEPGNYVPMVPHRDGNAGIYNASTSGHQFDFNGRPGAGYPSLNPAFSVDSCMSIVLHRSGTFLMEDDYSFDNDAWRPFANRGIGSFFPFMFFFPDLGGPFSFFNDFFTANNNPDPQGGSNVDARIRPHGPGVGDLESMVMHGSFDSAADVLDVPLYKFGSMSVSIMADPPSAFRFDRDSDGRVDADSDEFAAVSYYVAFSDVVDVAFYNQFINPDGADGRNGTGDDPDMDRVLYRLEFSVDNRPGSTADCIIPLTPRQLRAVGAGVDGTSSKITIASWDNFNNLDVMGPQFTSSPFFGSELAALGAAGSLERRFGWDDVPEPESPPFSDGIIDARPTENAYWNNAISDVEPVYGGAQFTTVDQRSAWAFDGEGDPYLTGRVQVEKWDDDAGTATNPEQRTDEIVKLYMQYNEEADIPFRVDALPVRVAGDQYEIRSAFGGAETDNGYHLLYDWELNGDPATADTVSWDGTWPQFQAGQSGDPRNILVQPEANTVSLRLYDLRSFQDAPNGLPVAVGYPPLPGTVFAGSEVQNPPVLGGTFPAAPVYAGTWPTVGTTGYAQDLAIPVSLIATTPQVLAEVAVEEPSLYDDDVDLTIRGGAAGGQLPYNYRVRILSGTFGDQPVGAGPYLGPTGTTPLAVFPGALPAASRAAGAANTYFDFPNNNVAVLREISRTSNDPLENFEFRPGDAADPAIPGGNPNGVIPAGEYWVEIQVTDSAGAPVQDHAYSKLIIGNDSTPSGSSGNPPEFNASINMRELGDNRRGFVASAAIDGGSGNFEYYWQVSRPLYDADGMTIIDRVAVDSSAPFVGIDAVGPSGLTGNPPDMISSETNPTFEFHTRDFVNNITGVGGADGIADANGVYFVDVWVVDAGNNGTVTGGRAMSHDVAMFTITDSGTGSGEAPSGDGLSRTPMALLFASPPGNAAVSQGNNGSATGGADPPYIGSITIDQAVDADMAANGEVITIRGYNFHAPALIPGNHLLGVASDNIVHFAGGVSARAISVSDEGVNHSVGGTPYRQLALQVVVPDGAQTGFITVQTDGGTSGRIFFQTGFNVVFDLLGSISPNEPSYLRYDLDFQGDGVTDFSYSSLSNPDNGGQLRGGTLGIVHDYASDGVGNYNATLTVTDLVSGRRQTSNQLVTIKDLRPISDGQITVAAGTVTATDGIDIEDAAADFLAGDIRGGDLIINTSLAPSEGTNVVSVTSATQLNLSALDGGGAWSVGDNYQIVRAAAFSGVNPMLVNIWPDVSMRSETFTADPSDGVAFRSTVGGVAAANLEYKWKIDEGSNNTSNGGELVASGFNRATDVSGAVLTDTATNFNTEGVSVGDLVVNVTDGSTATVISVDGPNQLTIGSTADGSLGLSGGGGVVRGGVADNGVPSNTNLIDNVPGAYDFDGNSFTGQGGIIIGDPVQNLTDGVAATVVNPAVNGTMITTALPGGAPVLKRQGVSDPGPPPGSNGMNMADFNVNFPFGTILVGDLIERYTDGTFTTLQASGTVTAVFPMNVSRVSTSFAGWAANRGYRIYGPGAPANWSNGDNWQVSIPANQWRIGFQYEIYSFDGFTSQTYADADYATDDAVVDFYLRLTYPFDLNPSPVNPSLVEVDWDNNGTYDDSFAVGDTTRLDGSVNGLEFETIRIPHNFAPTEYPLGGGPTNARYRVTTTLLGQTNPTTYGPFALPVVMIELDDFDQDLRTLNLDSQSWDNSSPHRVSCEVSFSQSTILTETPLGGTTNFLYRNFHASDAISVPAGTENRSNSLSTWVSYSTPFIFNNTPGSVSMRHQGVHGSGPALNWMSDANADGEWEAGLSSESPQGDNPVNYHEFVFQNGSNLMNVPSGNLLKGGSFPFALPGVGQETIAGGFSYFQANRGVYNGMGFVADELPSAERAFSFDSQALFIGDRIGGGNGSDIRPLAADIYIDPIISSNTQLIQMRSFVTGGSAPYTYQWQVQKTTGAYVGPVGVDGTYAGVSATVSDPLLIPFEDISDEGGPVDDGAGEYQVFLDVFDSAGGTYRTAFRVINVSTPPLSANVMANPPSGSVGDQIEFNIFVDGGQPDYTVDIDFESDGLNVAQGDLVGYVMESGSGELFDNFSYSEPGSYLVTVTVNDSAGGNSVATTTVEIAETIPLNANILLTPSSGVAPFFLNVHYTVSGGRELAGDDDYNVLIELISVDGTAQPAVTRTDSNTFGANGVLDDPRDPGSDDEPVGFIVPAAGNYYVQLIATDNGGRMKTARDDVFASGYLLPTQYGDDRPQVERDMEGRPMHAVRIWQDPYVNIDSGGTNNWQNVMDGQLGGGRLLEGDIQVIGDVISVDPNYNFRSSGNFATDDPIKQPLYYADYSLDSVGDDLVQDFYDTYSMGRVNINTASEQVLTALFRKIRRIRGYDFDTTVDLDNDGTSENYRVMRNAALDVYLTEAEARDLARRVIEYRTAYYDAHKPAAPDSGSSFGYERSSFLGGYPELAGSFRVDHLPVIGPWDGTNPHEYSVTDRNADLQNADDDVNNAWDNMAATYYNIDPDAFSFYAPSDIAVVRDRWEGEMTILLPGGTTITQPASEPPSNYAKYLNDVATNDFWYVNRGPFFTDWSATGLYQDSTTHYSRWGFDARNYFTYSGGEYDILLDAATDPGNPSVSVTPVPGSIGQPADARNRIGIIEGNDETAYGYIPNPPFRNIFDLYKVIAPDQNPLPFNLVDSGGFSELELISGGTTDGFTTNSEVLSGPSVFRYVARWDDIRGEFLPIANYLDDIAPFITTRSFVFRVEGSGAVTASGGSTGAYLDTAKLSRDRSRTAVIDVGPMYSRRVETPTLSDAQRTQGLNAPDEKRSYQILYMNEERE